MVSRPNLEQDEPLLYERVWVAHELLTWELVSKPLASSTKSLACLSSRSSAVGFLHPNSGTYIYYYYVLLFAESLSGTRYMYAGTNTLTSFFFFFWWTGTWTQSFTLTKQALYNLSPTTSSVCSGYFRDWVSQTVCPGWPRTVIFPISAS
jgi:hypothetical protein